MRGAAGIVLLLAVLAGPVPPGAWSEGLAEEPPAVRTPPFTGVPSDEQLHRLVLAHLDWDDQVAAAAIEVAVEDRIVILRGTVPNYGMRLAAERDALAVQGVRAVDNRLEVLPPEAAPGDELIAANVERLLAWSPDVREMTVRVSVRGGMVTLEGVVDALYRKHGAEDIAAQVFGVLDVINRIVVVPTGDVEDARIAAQVRAAVARNRQVRVNDLIITVLDGVVRLSGMVPDSSARRAALDAARHTAGVREVEDHLIVR